MYRFKKSFLRQAIIFAGAATGAFAEKGIAEMVMPLFWRGTNDLGVN